MKSILSALLVLLSGIIMAQSPILDINTDEYPRTENAYYKDIDNFYDQFVGTWVYTDATKTIRFRFVKKEMFYNQSVRNYYKDYLVGEMQYIENGVVKINSLDSVLDNHSSILDYSLHSIGKTYNDLFPRCLECPENMERMAMKYNEPTNDDVSLGAAFVMRRADENGVQKIKVQYVFTEGPSGVQFDFETPSTTTGFTIPYGDYTLVKEN
jgi:hypothetical protein